MPTHRITNADDVRSGNAASLNRALLGVPMENLVVESFIPVVASANSICTSQAVTGLEQALLNGTTAGVLDVPRNVVAAWTNAATITVTGKDVYGQTMTETATGTALTGKKAFKTITSVVFSVSVIGATVGSGALLGLSYRPVIGGFIRGRLGEDSADAGTYAAPERSASTATTNDVRGTYAYAGTANGTNVFTVAYVAANGPSDSDAYGIAQA